jgi:hypothetical protein
MSGLRLVRARLRDGDDQLHPECLQLRDAAFALAEHQGAIHGKTGMSEMPEGGHSMKVVYVAHPLGAGADRERNRIAAAKWVAWVGDQGVAPMADWISSRSWIILSGEWDETKREAGLKIDFALIERCDELWLVGSCVSSGMKLEAEHALDCGKPVMDFTWMRGELPPEVVTADHHIWHRDGLPTAD